jgi:hypothetical protein
MQHTHWGGAENSWACLRRSSPKGRLVARPGWRSVTLRPGAHPPNFSSSLPPSRPASPIHQTASPQHSRPPSTMAPRQKKEDTGELMVSIEQYTRTRDSVCILLLLLLVRYCDAPASCYRAIATPALAHDQAHSLPRIMVSSLCTHLVSVAWITRLGCGASEDTAACAIFHGERERS